MNLTGFADVHGAPLTSDQATPLCALGMLGMDSRGRLYRYVMAGVAPLVQGQALQTPAEITAHQELVPTVAQPIGARQLVLTLGAVAASENQYAEGVACVTTTPGEGWAYGISGHAAVLSAGVITLNLRPDDLLQAAIATTSRVTLYPHSCRGVIQAPAALTGAPVGVAVYPIGAGRYGWVGVCGEFPCLIAGTPGVGQAVSITGTAGAAAINSTTLPIIGNAVVTGVAGKYQPVHVNCL